MPTFGYATLQVIPSIRGSAGMMTKQLAPSMTEAGRKAGNDFGGGVAKGIDQQKASVQKASSQVTAARNKEADAAGKVRVAEAQLESLRERGVTDAGRVAQAEEKVATAKRNHAAASSKTRSELQNLTAAQSSATTSSNTLAAASDNVGRKSLLSADNFKAAAAGMTAIVGAAAVVGKALYEVGSQFDDMGDALRIGTGASGAALDALTKSAKNVAATTPAMEGGIAQVGETMADLNTRLGLTGKPLEHITSQMIQLKNMGQEVDLNNVTGALSGFGLKGADASKALDELFRVSQSTGVTVDDLAKSAIKGGPALRQFGYGIGDSAALIGVLDRSGLDADKTLAAMTKSLSVFAKEGKNPKEALNGTITSIDGLIKKGDQVGAINIASKLFGTRGAAQFVDAVKSGSLSVEGLKAATAGTGDTILGVADDTADFAEAWQLFKQKALIAIEPIATKVFGLLSQGMAWIADHGVPAMSALTSVVGPVLGAAFGAAGSVITTFVGTVRTVGEFVGRNRGAFIAVASVITALFLPALITSGATMVANAATMAVMTVATRAYSIGLKVAAVATRAFAIAQTVLKAAFVGNPIGLLIAGLVALGAAIFLAWKKSETFRNIVTGAWNGIKSAAAAAWGFLKGVFDALKGAFGAVGAAAGSVIGFVQKYWQYLLFALGPMGMFIGTIIQIVKHFDLIKAAFSAVGSAAMWLWSAVMVPVWGGIQAAIGVAWAAISGVFNLFMAGLRTIGNVGLWLWNAVLTPVWNGIRAGAQLMWAGIGLVFSWLQSGITTVGNIIRAVADTVINVAWNSVKAGADFMWGGINVIFGWIKSGWTALGSSIGWVVDNIIKPAWNGMKIALQAVSDFFGTTVSGIGAAWNKVKGFVATPINFVINTVWNNGLLKAWNKVAGFLPGLKQMSPLAPVAFAEGGPVPFGRGAKRGKDSVHALMMPGEHVWDVADVNHAGGQRAMYNMRGMVESGRPFTWTPDGMYAGNGDPDLALAFAGGGAVEPGAKLSPGPGEGGLQDIAKLFARIIRRMWPKGVSSIGGYRPPDGYNEHSTGRALDVMINDPKTGTAVKDFSIANSKHYPVDWTIWQQKMWYPGGRSEGMEDRGSPTQNHMDHDHIFYKDQSVNPNVVPDNLITSGFGGMSDADMMGIIKKKISEIIDKALNPIKQGITKVIGAPPPEWLGIPPQILDITKDKALDAAFGIVQKLGPMLEKAYDMAKKVTSSVTNFVKSPFKAFGKLAGGLFRDQGGFVPKGQSVVTNETGKPEAVLNWDQLNSVKDLMDKGATLSQAVAQVGAKKTDTIPDGAVVLKHDATVQDVADAVTKLQTAADAQQKQQAPKVDPTAGQPNTSGAGTASQPGKLKSLKELGQDAGGLLAEGIGDFFGLPSWITDPSSALQADDGSNVRTTDQGATAGNSALTNTPDTTANPNTTTPGTTTPQATYQDPQYGDGSTIGQKDTPLTTKMPDIPGGPDVKYNPGGGAEQWRSLAQWAIDYVNRTLKGPNQVQAMVEQIGDESGGNPRAVNNSDSNAAQGTPSGGLLQVIEPTFQSYRDPRLPNDKFNPKANLVAALRYYVPTYGNDLTARWGHGKGGYKLGGYTGNLGINDIAGFVHGREFVTSAGPTRKNLRLLELINSGADVESALVGGHQRWGSVADRASTRRAGAGVGGHHTSITVYGNTTGDIVQDIDRKQWRGAGGYGSRER